MRSEFFRTLFLRMLFALDRRAGAIEYVKADRHRLVRPIGRTGFTVNRELFNKIFIKIIWKEKLTTSSFLFFVHPSVTQSAPFCS